MAHSYPRLDVEVSKKMNHLLKAPFCVHPKTGKVCVPIDPAAAWDFDVDAVPTLDAPLCLRTVCQNQLHTLSLSSRGQTASVAQCPVMPHPP